jgi:SAM-dependent methyltransferase
MVDERVSAQRTTVNLLSTLLLRQPEPAGTRAAPRASSRDSLLVRVVRRGIRTFVRWGSVTFFVRQLDESVAAGAADAAVREVSEIDLGWIADGANPSQSADVLRRRFRRGDRCFAAVDAAGRAAHVRWVTAGRALIPELGLDVVMRGGEAYFYDGYTRPDARGQGVDGRVRNEIFRVFKARGYARVWSYVRSDNPTGLRAAAKWQQMAGRLAYFTICGVRTFVGASDGGQHPPLRPHASDDADARVAAWRRWFHGWLQQPLERRSTGFHALPPEYFDSAAEFIAATLRLDPQSDRVLDVGCDSAMVSRRLVSRCFRYTGVDFVAAMLADARGVSQPETTRPLSFVAGDGRRLPFATGSFKKAFCSAVIHTLPTHEDGEAIVRELVRVCAPGGQVLIASVPDVRKRWAGRRALLLAAPWWRRPGLVAYWCVPGRLRSIIKRLAGRPAQDPMRFLEYDLRTLARGLQAEGVECRVLDFPADYWSRDFRVTRSNLLISIPPATEKGSVAA